MNKSIQAILVAEDDDLTRMLLANSFSEVGFEVLEASNGAEAVQAVRERRDIVASVTDVQMPGEPDGVVLSHYARAACPNCAIVVVTGRSSLSAADLAAGARLMLKPFKQNELVSLVQRMIVA